MNTIFSNSENSKTPNPHRLLLNLTDWEDKINVLLYQILVFTIHGKMLENPIRTINSRFHLQHGMKNWNYLIDHIQYQIFKAILNLY